MTSAPGQLQIAHFDEFSAEFPSGHHLVLLVVRYKVLVRIAIALAVPRQVLLPQSLNALPLLVSVAFVLEAERYVQASRPLVNERSASGQLTMQK